MRNPFLKGCAVFNAEQCEDLLAHLSAKAEPPALPLIRAHAMPLPRFIDIHGRRYFWRDLVARRRAEAAPGMAQTTLFELRTNYRPPGECTATERYLAPSLFTLIECGSAELPADHVEKSRKRERRNERSLPSLVRPAGGGS